MTPGGGNLLAALGLLCYTEFAGKLRFGVKRADGSDVASANFNQFFDLLGPEYQAFRGSRSLSVRANLTSSLASSLANSTTLLGSSPRSMASRRMASRLTPPAAG